jgi:hypothetical protein
LRTKRKLLRAVAQDPKSLTMSVLRLTALFTTIPPGGFSPPGAPLENIEIRAVNRSAAQSPWNAIKRAPGVGSHSPSKASMRDPRG